MSVQLRPLQLNDKARLAKLANNRKIWDNLRNRMPHPYSEEDAVSFISIMLNEQPAQTFAIEYSKEFCGVISLLLQDDIYTGTAELGYWIGEPYWNKGIATEAIRQITNYGFDKLQLRRIYANVFSLNTISGRVLEKNGYNLEAIRKNAVIKNGIVYDDYSYVKLK